VKAKTEEAARRFPRRGKRQSLFNLTANHNLKPCNMIKIGAYFAFSTVLRKLFPCYRSGRNRIQ